MKKEVNVFFCYLSVFINSLLCADFPALEFFQSVGVDINPSSQINRYLCQQMSKSKCCSCEDDCYPDCCIDRYWNRSALYDLSTYLETFKRIQEETIASKKLQCQPIISPLIDEEITDSVWVEKCNRTKQSKIPSENRIVYNHATSQFYPHIDCTNGTNISYPDLEAHCATRLPNISNGLQFTTDLRKSLGKCIFRLSQVNRCGFKYNCDKKNPMYSLCRLYKAPFQKYKNPHCFRCLHQHTKPIFLIGCRNFQIIQKNNPIQLTLKSTKEGELEIKSITYKFPFLKFINKKIEQIDYSYNGLIVGCKQSNFQRCCDCESDCFNRKTCCPDVLWIYQNPKMESMELYSQTLVDRSRNGKYHTCIAINSFKTSYKAGNEIRYLMVTTCAPDSKYYEFCTMKANFTQNWEFIVPVLGIDGYLYKNLYCALCHSVYDFKPVNLSGNCELIDSDLDMCDFKIHKEQRKIKGVTECFYSSNLIETCSKSHKYYDLCQSYVEPFNGYRNPHCYFCHHNSTQVVYFQDKECTQFRLYVSWFMLIEFKKNLEISNIENKLYRDTSYCANTKFSDIHTTTTQQECQLERTVHNPNFDNCMLIFGLTLFIIYPENSHQIKGKEHFIKIVLQEMNFSKETITVYHQSKTKTIFKVDALFDSLKLKTTLQLYQRNFIRRGSGASFIFTMHQKPLLHELYNLSFSNQFSDGRLCYDYSLVDEIDLLFISNCSIVYKRTVIDYHNFSYFISMEFSGIKRSIVRCKRFYTILSCTSQENDITTVYEEGSKMVLKVCKQKESSIFADVEKNLFYILLPFSLVGYAMVIITYAFFKSLQSLPGLSTIALASCLMMGDFMFFLNGVLNLTGYNRFYYLCKVNAILMHFFLVKAYIWTLMISYDIMYLFTRAMASYKHTESKQKFCRYFITSSFVSLGIVGVAFALDYADIVLIGYGEDGTCVPHKFYGRVIFYTTPLFVCVFFSFFTLLRTTVFFAMEKRRQKKRLRDSFLKKVSVTLMFLKLSSVLGINDIIGIAQLANYALADSQNDIGYPIIGLVYSVMRSMRGVLLFIVYVCKVEIITLYKAHFCMKMVQSSQDSIGQS